MVVFANNQSPEQRGYTAPGVVQQPATSAALDDVLLQQCINIIQSRGFRVERAESSGQYGATPGPQFREVLNETDHSTAPGPGACGAASQVFYSDGHQPMCPDNSWPLPVGPLQSTVGSCAAAAEPASKDILRPTASAMRRRRRQRAAATLNQTLSAGPAEPAGYSALPAPVKPKRLQPPQLEVCASLERRCAILAEKLEHGGEERQEAVAELRGAVCQLTFTSAGCRVVQLALEVVDKSEATDLVEELLGHVLRAIASPHGNYVIQKVVEVMPAALAAFVVEELRGVGAEMSRHRYGCRIMCRLLEHSANNVMTIMLIDEVLRDVDDLCRHSFGHHVIESILEHGLKGHKQRIAESLRSMLLTGSINRHVTYVIEMALLHCEGLEHKAVTTALLGYPGGIAALADNLFGCRVVRALLRLPCEDALAARLLLQSSASKLRASKYGCRVLAEAEQRNAVPIHV